MTNKEIIYEAYLKAYSMAKGKVINPSQFVQKRTDITRRIDKCLLTCRYSVSEVDKKNAVLFGKNVYREYCSFVVANPRGKTDQLKTRILEMLDTISEIEEQEVVLYNQTLQEECELDLKSILKKGVYIKEITLNSMADVIKHAVKDKHIEAVKMHEYLYITPKGKMYHKKDCPYCKNKLLKLVDENYENYKPCVCVKGKVQKKEIQDEVDNKSYITAFFDESKRDDPWKIIDPSRTKKQNVMSYVMCEGFLQNECEISDENVVEEDVYLSPNKGGSLSSAINETLARIMIKAAQKPHIRNLVIYSDNQGACEGWENIASLRRLAQLFDSVTIEFIPREKNKYADKLGRKKDVIVADKDEILELMSMKNNMRELLEEMAFVKSYFPYPKEMIPNLVEELRLIAEDKKSEVGNAS